MEGVLIIASEWKLELLPREYVEMLPRTTLRPKKEIMMRVRVEISFILSRNVRGP